MASVKNPVGRPLKFPDVEALQERIGNYFQWREETGKPYTITSLAVYLDTSRETLLEYSEREEFVDTINSAKKRIEAWSEDYLYEGKNVAGAIFSMKNNWGWKDRTETDITSNGETIGLREKTDAELLAVLEEK